MTTSELVGYYIEKVRRGEITFDKVRPELVQRGITENDIRTIVRQVDEEGRRCTLDLQQRYVSDLPARDRETLDVAKASLARYGLAIDDGACETYAAAMGAEPFPFRFCPVTVKP